jgi:flavin reductase (DIM6/NTAB) family NADH-FMN oxidoreductase RutF
LTSIPSLVLSSIVPMFDPVYTLLRNLTSPVVAITSSAGGVRNGLIVNSAQRASLVPSIPRLSIYISKINFTHDLVYKSGVFTLHLLRNDQWDLIWHLGFQSGRDVQKLDSLKIVEGVTGCPILEDCVAGFECAVVNAMDTGASTFFLGEVVNVAEGQDGGIMTSDYFRQHMPAERRLQYEANLRAAQGQLEAMTREIDRAKVWPGPVVAP